MCSFCKVEEKCFLLTRNILYLSVFVYTLMIINSHHVIHVFKVVNTHF
jgi:hypothetical protein